MLSKLDLGCGYVDAPEWVSVDKLDYGHNIIADVLEGLPFPDNHFDFVMMNHTLQMFTYEELPVALKEVKRVMKDAATLRILVPDIERAIAKWRDCEYEYFPISDELEIGISSKFLRYIYWHGDARSGFDEMSLTELLHRSGFKVDMNLGKFGDCELDSRESESLIMECKK